jgi:hypothetical protein
MRHLIKKFLDIDINIIKTENYSILSLFLRLITQTLILCQLISEFDPHFMRVP